jgi:uroporphyrinogen decarboxylase
MENLCIMMADDPDLVHEMADFWKVFIEVILKKMCSQVELDSVMISEDMAYKAHSMISPDMTREFIQGAYFNWVPILKNSGCSIIELDSDGCVDDLIPIWIESGINCNSPVEVAAHCDILEYRRRYGKLMSFKQGIDKRIMARGGKELEEHVMKIVPKMFQLGGFIPGCDHGVPPDISWQNFIEFARLIAKLSGWL